MVRIYKRKTDRGLTSEEDMRDAIIQVVMEGQSLSAVSVQDCREERTR